MCNVSSRVFPVLVVALALTACTPTTSLWSDADAHRQIDVQRVQFTHDVLFAPGNAQITSTEASRLSGFLARQQVGYGDRVTVLVPGDDPRLDARRISAVVERLGREGIDAERGVARAQSGVQLVVSRSVAVPPPCPDWRKADNDGDPSNTPMSNMGCANMRNLSLMVADPTELVAGRPLDGGSGEPLAAGVERYRAGKTTPLLNWTTTSP